MPQPTQSFEVVNRFLGWGEPRGGLWFVGLEEATGWDSTHNFESISKHYEEIGGVYSPPADGIDFKGQVAGRNIRNYTSKIAFSLSLSGATDWRDYRDSYLWTKRSTLFQANLFPLGKPSRSEWPIHFESLFGFGLKDRGVYEQHVRNTRFKTLALFWKESQPQAVVCFGKEGWNHFQNVFGLGDSIEIEAGKVYAYPKERVILTSFFARHHMTNSRALSIAKVLCSWGVAIDRRSSF